MFVHPVTGFHVVSVHSIAVLSAIGGKPRILAALFRGDIVLIPAVLFGDIGLIATLMGLGDLTIGLAYMVGPKELGVSHQALLFDRLG